MEWLGVWAAGWPGPSNVPQGKGLSLEIELPTVGHKLVFTKVGGDPKLTLAIRPQATVRYGINVVWSAVWILIGLAILSTLRTTAGVCRLPSLFPMIAIAAGILGFFALPSPLNGVSFALFLVGAIAFAWQHRLPQDNA